MSEVRDGLVEQLPWLRRYALSLTRNRSAAEDLVQDVCERALARATQFQPGSSMKGWLGTIMYHMHLNGARRRAREIATAEVPDRPAGDRADIRVVVRDVERALARLPRKQSEAVLLLGVDGLSYEEAAAVQGVVSGTFKSRASRGKARLAEECCL